MQDTPFSLLLVNFLAKEASEQVLYFDEVIPSRNKGGGGPLCPLVNSMQAYLHFFFDHFPSSESDEILNELSVATSSLAAGRFFVEDFMEGCEWDDVRKISRRMLMIAGNPVCNVPMPIPLQEWTYHFNREGYS